MLDGILDVTTGITLSFGNMILTVVVSFVLGIAISLVHIKTHSEGYYSQNFALTLAVLPSIIAIIIMLIGSNIARAFSLAGTFMSFDLEVKRRLLKILRMCFLRWL